MALGFGHNRKFTKSVIPKSFMGINIFHHGPSTLTTGEEKDFMAELGNLVTDYPLIPSKRGGTLKELHLYHQLETMNRLNPAVDVHKDFFEKHAYEGLEALGVATALPDQPGAIGLNIGGIRRMSKIGLPESIKLAAQDVPGKLAPNTISRVLTHEFGHHVQFSEAAKITDDDMKIGLLKSISSTYETTKKLFNEMDFSKKDIRESIPKGTIAESVKELIAEVDEMHPAHKQGTKVQLHHQQVVSPLMKKFFDTEANTPGELKEAAEQIGSTYAASNTIELFAETFARGRMGSGPGAEKARKFEEAIRLQAKSAKEAANSRNAHKALKAMGSGLVK